MSKLYASVLALSFVLTAGCRAAAPSYGTGAVGRQAPPPQPGQVIQPWENFCVYPGNHLDAVLNDAGANGWELVAIDHAYAMLVCFKRPVAPAPPLPGPGGVTPPAA